ncbi:molecular chaperone [Enterobacteriaceae bacterium 4M9]|nr:molecular chaperone [Enterobacteriaceae bacterium 4M9]
MGRFVIAFLLFGINAAQAAINVDRTRLVFNGSDKTISIGVTNTDNANPYLVQSWIEDADMNRLPIDISPLIVVPPVMRMDGGEKSALRISATSHAALLPSDRESLFYLNVREIPKKKQGENVLQVAIQTTLKVIYRPATIKRSPLSFDGSGLTLTRTREGLKIANSTPYYFTVVGLSVNKNDTKQEGFESFSVAPYASSVIKNNLPDTAKSVWATFINDYGGRPQQALTVM